MEMTRFVQLHQRLWGTSTAVIVITLVVCVYAWWRAQPIGLVQLVCWRISMWLLISNSMLGIGIALLQSRLPFLHMLYGVIVLVPFIGVHFLTKFQEKSAHAMYFCIALLLILAILRRIALTAPH